jgi:hypothetical protein
MGTHKAIAIEICDAVAIPSPLPWQHKPAKDWIVCLELLGWAHPISRLEHTELIPLAPTGEIAIGHTGSEEGFINAALFPLLENGLSLFE